MAMSKEQKKELKDQLRLKQREIVCQPASTREEIESKHKALLANFKAISKVR